MRVEKVGEGEPQYSIIGSIHGDEPCGKKAIEKFLAEKFELKKPVQFIIANEKALEEGRRFLEADLNRSFPGNPDSENYEERLAAEIMEKVNGTRVIDLHSTHSYPEPFATVSDHSEETKELVSSAGVKYAVEFPINAGALTENVEGIVVESGHQGTDQAAENAYNVIKNFLAAEGVIEADFKHSDPEFFRHIGTVEGNWEFVAENFEEVEEGEVFAKREGEELRAENSFYPVLMSTNGYDGILGHKAKKLD